MRQSFFSKGLASASLALLAAALVFSAIAAALVDRLTIDVEAQALLKTVAVAGDLLAERATSGGETPPRALQQTRTLSSAEGFETWAKNLAELSACRVTLLDSSGKVVADSQADPSSMENHALRPEVVGAQKGKASWALRRSTTTGERTLYAALRLASPQDWVLRLANPLPSFSSRLYEARWVLGLVLLFLCAVALSVGLTLSRGVSRPIQDLVEKAQAYAKGSQAPKLHQLPHLPRELRPMDEALDELVAGTRERAAEAELLGNRLSAILEAVGEGIVAVDDSLVVLEANSASAALFGVPKGSLRGKTFLEAFRNREASDFLSSCLASETEGRGTIRLLEGGDRHVKVHAARFSRDPGQAIVAVFSDVSELVRLERVRKEFVANVSHELRTPVQIIRGYAELISAGTLEREEAATYASRIEHTALRMERIVADLLLLARLENGSEQESRFEPCALGPLFASVLALLEPQAAKKDIHIETSAQEDLTITANPGLVEQAVFNLLDNAVAYSPEGSSVRLSARRLDSGEVEIEVADHGIGIPQAELPRIFERFYRVDKSRSKATGGTGLGLSIVKHIAEVHGGSVHASSYLGEGTTFTLILPSKGAAQASPKAKRQS